MALTQSSVGLKRTAIIFRILYKVRLKCSFGWFAGPTTKNWTGHHDTRHTWIGLIKSVNMNELHSTFRPKMWPIWSVWWLLGLINSATWKTIRSSKCLLLSVHFLDISLFIRNPAVASHQIFSRFIHPSAWAMPILFYDSSKFVHWQKVELWVQKSRCKGLKMKCVRKCTSLFIGALWAATFNSTLHF